MSIPAGIDPSDFLDLHYCEECRKIGDFDHDLCGECVGFEYMESIFTCNHCGQIFTADKDEGGVCSQCIKRDLGGDGGEND